MPELTHAVAAPEQSEWADGPRSSLLTCLVIAARHRGIQLSVRQLVRDYMLGPGEISLARFLEVVKGCGLRANVTRLGWRALLTLDRALPAIVRLKNGAAMVVTRVEPGAHPPRVLLHDPNAHEDALLTLDEDRFTAAWSGEVVLIKRDYRIQEEEQPFGLRTIAGQLLRDRRITRDIAVAGFLLSLLAVAPILFWRLLLDRVLYDSNINTLVVLCIAMGVLVAFETVFGYLRRYLIAHSLERLDAKMTTDIFNKVLALPVDFFESKPVGEIARDMNEIHKIRRFLVDQLFGTVLDMMVLLVFLPIMFFFSVLLTGFVLGICVLIGLWIVVMLPVLHRKAGLVFGAEGEKGAFLVETLHGIRTVKSLALDSRRRHEWDVLAARAARLRFDESQTANVISTVINPLERLMTSGVFALAVFLAVTSNQSTYVGALVAFMMLTQRVAAPLLSLAHMLQAYDEARLAVDVLKGLVNQPAEEGRSRSGVRTPLVGRIEFNGVRFRYRGTIVPALDDVSFAIPEATIFGIMGRSGSGKTTVTRLMQRLHSNYQGLIKVDGNDLRQIDIDHLRGSIGVVLQENFLFRGTIRETIGTAKPDASFEDIVQAARLAGAEEFIERLPKGYETFIQEGSTNLSGGQRQRLAIARALIGDPRILILDEATSALDAESEAIVNANLLQIARSRTLVIISHRLSSLVAADAILVLERGRVYDIGRHDELLDRCDIYSGLWHQQHRHLQPDRSTHEIIPLLAGAAA
jgi:ATP-binding cassette, subfamily B, bacterial HlyB/CyaB